MNPTQQKVAAKEFVKRWQAAEGNEDGEDQKFWIELYRDVLGFEEPTRVLNFQRRIAGRKCDVFHEDQRVLVEMKSRGVSLDKSSIRSKKAGEETPYEQALWYYNHLGTLSKPYWLITCNFDELRIYDMREEIPDEGAYVSLKLAELPDKAHLLGFITDTSTDRIQVEKELSIQAAELVGKLYDGFSKQYANLDTSAEEQHSLNVLIVRLVFLLYAEDAGLLQEHQAFLHYLQKFDVPQMRRALIDLFDVLDTPYAERDPYMDEDLAAFPYVNGGLFAGSIIIPQFTLDLRVCLLAQASAGFDWKGISPTIFGAAFESTLNPETRRSGGMHYTSIENIHKVIDPLFLDDLKAELAEIEGEKVEKTRKMRLKLFQRKLAGINILDPACGSGNFLTESYICLRHLENRVLADLLDESQIGMDLGGDDSQIMVNIDQLYGIEINDFAVSVAKTALWIAESQAMEETQDILFKPFEFLPLKSVNNLHCGNALRMDWNEVLPAEECSYCLGNPPYKGAHASELPRTPEQTAELVDAFGGAKGVADADYVAAWFAKSADYCTGTNAKVALVATNSIGQGQQPGIIWPYLWDRGIAVDFSYQPFLWGSEANDKAAVAVTIVGFSEGRSDGASYFETDYKTAEITAIREVANIGPYLKPGTNEFVINRPKPLCDVPEMGIGNKPIDGGNYIFTTAERDEFLISEPGAEKYIHPFLGSKEFINGKQRWILWLGETDDSELGDLPKCRERIEAVRQCRAASKSKPTQKLAETPKRFHVENIPNSNYIVVPEVTSERREYVPIGFLTPSTLCSNKLKIVRSDSLYLYGVLQSQFHNAWMRQVAGRMKNDYSYSSGVVYNNFVWPEPGDELRERIEACAQAVLDARDAHPGKSLADLYNPDKMPADLLTAHKALDAAVEAAYGVDFGGDEERIVAHLFKLYAELTAEE